ncbi:DNA-binding protein [Fusobacterium necrophorum subsp. funduliforme]|nr:hypothetical protein A2U15_08490 [Fusobacterium necrophorum subsp. funduliforme]KYM57606.1 hypothetical protein A2U07_08755 [Fusobacterium necrophorum subsp. funduliforme]KYM58932.1 hypothetical protein A2U09_06795 [Fusobacterium necrophorum subsp. funduliforme]
MTDEKIKKFKKGGIMKEIIRLLSSILDALQKPKKKKIFLTVGEAVQEMGTSREVIYKMMTYPDFPMNYVNSKRLVRIQEVPEWLQKHNREDFGK